MPNSTTGFTQKLADQLSKWLLAAPPAIQLSVAISALIGPVLTLGPFVQRLFEIWMAFSRWVKNVIEGWLGLSISPILWPNIFLIGLSVPMLFSIAVSLFKKNTHLHQWRENLRTSVLALLCITVIVELYYLSIAPNRFDTLFDAEDSATLLTNLALYLKVIWVIVLSAVFFLKNEQKAVSIFNKAIYILAALLLIDLLVGAFSLYNVLNLDTKRIIAYSFYEAGTLSKEAYIELLKIYLFYEYGVYSSFLAKVVLVSYFALSVYLPGRIIDISKFVGFSLFLLVSYSALELFLKGGK